VGLSVARPGLDPGNLGFEPEGTEASVVVRVTWSAGYVCAPTFAEQGALQSGVPEGKRGGAKHE